MIVDPNYVDDGRLRPQDEAPLPVFLADRDRDQILDGGGRPFFSGREREVSAFREVANALGMNRQGNATLVVEGPPGAGKSALMMQFVEEMRGLPPTGDDERRWLPVLLDGAVALSPDEVMAAIDEAIAKRLAADLVTGRGGKQAERDLAAFLGCEALRGALSVARGIQTRGISAMGSSVGGAGEPRPDTIQHAARLRGRKWAKWQVVLMVDEAQGISGAAPGAAPGTLSAIHQGLGQAPISFCAFALPGTWDALSRVGVSRISAFHDLPLAGLDGAASRMAVDRCFERFGVRDAEAWARAIVDRSAGWPQHLSVYLHGALSVLKERAGADNDEVGSVRGASLRSAIALGDEARSDYYRRRLQRLDRDNPRHRRYGMDVARWLRGPNQPLPVHEALDRLGREHGLADEAGIAFLAAARHSGLFAEDADGNLTAPIPSFAGHLLGESLPDVREPHPEPSPSSSRSPTHGH